MRWDNHLYLFNTYKSWIIDPSHCSGDARKMVDKNIWCSLDGSINKYILWTGDDEPMVGWPRRGSTTNPHWSLTNPIGPLPNIWYFISIYDHLWSFHEHFLSSLASFTRFCTHEVEPSAHGASTTRVRARRDVAGRQREVLGYCRYL